MKNKNQDLLSLPFFRALFKLSLPIILANFLQSAYQFIDLFWLGRVSASAVAAISLSFPLILFFLSLGMGVSGAANILVSQYAGAKQKEKINFIVSQSFFASLLLALPLSLIGYLAAPWLIKLMGADKSVSSLAIPYLRVSFLGTFFIFGYFSFQGIMRGLGEVVLPFKIILFSVLLNLFLDPFFIFSLHLGAVGAAWATFVTQGISFCLGAFILLSGKKGVKIKTKNFSWDLAALKKIFSLGMPVSFGMAARSLGMAFLAFLIARLGTNIIAAYGTGIQIIALISMPMVGFSAALTTLIGQSIGARRLDKTEEIAQKGITFIFFLLSFLGILVFWQAPLIVSFFLRHSQEAAPQAVLFIRFFSLSFGFMGLQQAISGILRGSGRTFLAMLLPIFSFWFVRIPLVCLLLFVFTEGAKGVWLAFFLSNVFGGLFAAFLFFRQKLWLRERVKI